jgi:DNA-binding PadR family transcriptional regulator
MLPGIDVLHRLRDRAETAESLASVLPASEEETKRVLSVMERDGLVSARPAGYVADPSSFTPIYTVTPAGEAAYRRVLDRWRSKSSAHPR